MAIPQKKQYTIEEYFAQEAVAEYKSQYYYGEIFSMAGGTPQHSLISTNASAAFRAVLRGKPCSAYGSDLMVEINAEGEYTYPDGSIICGAIELSEKSKNAVKNPVLITEVLSDSTQKHDRKDKFYRYRQIPSLQMYVLIHQNQPLVEVYTRQGDHIWRLHDYSGLDAVAAFEPLEVVIPLTEFYENIAFDA